jgi:3-oxoacyl-[acyl-carrier-protein] synthase-3
MMKRSKIIGCGSYLPERVVTNAELSAKLDTTDEWITTRTGIRQRHLAADGELTSDLALNCSSSSGSEKL